MGIKTIIVVETDLPILEVLTLALEEFGFKVLPTNSYEEAAQFVFNTEPNLAIIDYKFDGREAKQLASLYKQAFPHLNLLAISCNSKLEKSYASEGFNGFVPKPFDLEEFIQLVFNFSI